MNAYRLPPNTPTILSPNATDAAAWMGYAVETDTGLTTAGGTKVITLGFATETDSAFAMTSALIVVLGLATETDSTFPLDSTTGTLLFTAIETDTPGQIFPGTKTVELGIADEIDTAIGFGTPTVFLGTAVEVDTAFGLVLTALNYRFFGPTDLVVGPIAADPRDSQGPLSQRLFSKYRSRERGRNIYILIDGTVTKERPTVLYPEDGSPPIDVEDQIAHTLWGGHIEPISPSEAFLLASAGYAANITLEPA
jgi:hypothetical protein